MACGASAGGPADSAVDSRGGADSGAGMADSDVPLACENVQDGQPCAIEGQRCGGPCADPCQFCNLWTCLRGRWARQEVFPQPCMDASSADATQSSDVMVRDSSFRPDPMATILIQEQGGIVGSGPAIAVRGDGAVFVWQQQTGVRFEPLDTSGSMRLPSVAPERVAELLALWQASNRDGLPHGPGALECSVGIQVKACTSCPTERLSYIQASQVLPELTPFFRWYSSNIANAPMSALPHTYCSGG